MVSLLSLWLVHARFVGQVLTRDHYVFKQVFDFHHQKFCPGGMTAKEAVYAAIATWPAGIRPVVHWSESQEGRKPHAHSDYVSVSTQCLLYPVQKLSLLLTGLMIDQYHQSYVCNNTHGLVSTL